MSLDIFLSHPDSGPAIEDNFYNINITHNLAPMAHAAGVYDCLWYADQQGQATGTGVAANLVIPLQEGLARLLAEPEKYKQFNPPNGWGNYAALVIAVTKLLHLCTKYPYAIITVSR